MPVTITKKKVTREEATISDGKIEWRHPEPDSTDEQETEPPVKAETETETETEPEPEPEIKTKAKEPEPEPEKPKAASPNLVRVRMIRPGFTYLTTPTKVGDEIEVPEALADFLIKRTNPLGELVT